VSLEASELQLEIRSAKDPSVDPSVDPVAEVGSFKIKLRGCSGCAVFNLHVVELNIKTFIAMHMKWRKSRL